MLKINSNKQVKPSLEKEQRGSYFKIMLYPHTNMLQKPSEVSETNRNTTNIMKQYGNFSRYSSRWFFCFFSCFSFLVSGVMMMVASLGCDSRGIGVETQNDLYSDGGTKDTGQPDPPLNDATPSTIDGATIPTDPCAPMDAYLPPEIRCDDPFIIGWMWNGESCSAVQCHCEGADCDRLYATKSKCLEDRAPDCLPKPNCLEHGYEECEAKDECEELYFGGGCLDLEDYCDWERSEDGYLICFERGWTCVSNEEQCSNRSREQCHGDCYWWEWQDESCFSEMGEEDCCVFQGFGICTPVTDNM